MSLTRNSNGNVNTGKRYQRPIKRKEINGENFKITPNKLVKLGKPVNEFSSNPLKISTEAPEAFFLRTGINIT